MIYSYITDPGRIRERNEDSVSIVKNAAGEILMVVADGMGGHKDGEVASNLAINLISERFKNISSIGNKEDAINWIQSTVSEANVEIFKYVAQHPESEGMGTTIDVRIKARSVSKATFVFRQSQHNWNIMNRQLNQ